MKGVTYEGTLENGQIKLAQTVQLSEHTRVLVVVPETEERERFTIATGEDGLPLIRTSNGVYHFQHRQGNRNPDGMTFLLDVNE